MKHSRKKLVLAFVVAVMMAVPCMAQDAEPPFTWEGKGSGSLISEGGIEDINFEFELSIDEQGMVGGKTSNEDGESKIKHVTSQIYANYPFIGRQLRMIKVFYNCKEAAIGGLVQTSGILITL